MSTADPSDDLFSHTNINISGIAASYRRDGSVKINFVNGQLVTDETAWSDFKEAEKHYEDLDERWSAFKKAIKNDVIDYTGQTITTQDIYEYTHGRLKSHIEHANFPHNSTYAINPPKEGEKYYEDWGVAIQRDDRCDGVGPAPSPRTTEPRTSSSSPHRSHSLQPRESEREEDISHAFRHVRGRCSRSPRTTRIRPRTRYQSAISSPCSRVLGERPSTSSRFNTIPRGRSPLDNYRVPIYREIDSPTFANRENTPRARPRTSISRDTYYPSTGHQYGYTRPASSSQIPYSRPEYAYGGLPSTAYGGVQYHQTVIGPPIARQVVPSPSRRSAGQYTISPADRNLNERHSLQRSTRATVVVPKPKDGDYLIEVEVTKRGLSVHKSR
ncbi:hypothetical protein P7C73_g2358, partial [Tremellales sp. Uapishka_1]